MLTRIAPTPSGFLHQGNVFNFLFTWLYANVHRGKILLRIDDMDSERCRTEYLEDIFRVLNELGLNWDLGPKSAEDFMANWSQRFRLGLYQKNLNLLVSKNLIFACECSRAMLPKNGIYPGTCEHKNIPLDRPDVVWRLRLDEDAKISFTDVNLGACLFDLHEITGCFIVRKRDGIPSYQLCSVTDDVHFGVTDIIRGEDLLYSTAMQLYLAKEIGITEFLNTRFTHHYLLKNNMDEKLSKSAGAERKPVVIAANIYSQFAEWMGWGNEALSLHDLLTLAGRKLRF